MKTKLCNLDSVNLFHPAIFSLVCFDFLVIFIRRAVGFLCTVLVLGKYINVLYNCFKFFNRIFCSLMCKPHVMASSGDTLVTFSRTSWTFVLFVYF